MSNSGIFTKKPRLTLGLTKEPYQPVDLKAIYEKVKKRRKEKQDKE